jgi:hypothetical protein
MVGGDRSGDRLLQYFSALPDKDNSARSSVSRRPPIPSQRSNDPMSCIEMTNYMF